VARDAQSGTLAASENTSKANGSSHWLDRIAALPAGPRAELARALRSHAGCSVPAGDAPSSRLVAYAVIRDSASVSPAQLRAFLAQRLPAAFVPASFVFLPALPRLPSGKLDRRGLPAPAEGRANLGRPYAPPRNPAEASVCQILGDVLGISDVGIHDTFWELSGDSLTAVRLVHRLRQEFGADLEVQWLFDKPTAALLATYLADARAADAARDQAPLVAMPRESRPPPLSSAQLRQWIHQTLHPASAASNICDTLRLTGSLDVAALEGALAAVIERHEILRTCYRVVDGEPQQEIAPPGPFSLAVADLRAMPAEFRSEVARELIAGDASQPFDLGRLPLLRTRLIRFTDTDSLFSVVAHHIVADDWAFNVLYDELSASYEAISAGRLTPLPPPPLQYADYAHWERRMLADRLATGLEYWQERLLTAPAAPPLPGPVDAIGRAEAGWYMFCLPDGLAGRFAAWCQSRSVTIFVACLAALAAVLGRQAGQDEIVIGVAVANRERLELERMIGCFMNHAALRIDVSGAPGPRELVSRVDRVVRACHAMQYVPYEKVVDAVRLARTKAGLPGAGAPLFDVVLNFVPEPALPRLGEVQVEMVDDPPLSQPAKHGLTLYLQKSTDALLGRVAYETGRLSRDSAAAIAAGFSSTIEEFVHDTAMKVSASPSDTNTENARDWLAIDAPERQPKSGMRQVAG
jgi:acyl carrier protein